MANMGGVNTGFFQRSQDFKPILVRLLARHKHGDPMTTLEIRQATSIPECRVHDISMSLDWEHVCFGEMQAFIKACGVNFESARGMKRVYSYLSDDKPKFSYLMKSPLRKTLYLPMLIKWRNAYPLKLEAEPFWEPLRKILNRINHLHRGYKKP